MKNLTSVSLNNINQIGRANYVHQFINARSLCAKNNPNFSLLQWMNEARKSGYGKSLIDLRLSISLIMTDYGKARI